MNEAAARHLANLLGDAAPLWRPAPFHDDPSWVIDAPALAGALLALSDADVEALEQSPDALAAFVGAREPRIAPLAEAANACLSAGILAAPLPVPETAGRDVPGRKWQQSLHFAAACGTPVGPLLDWCSGKAHLGRLLARVHAVPVVAVERDAVLCADGSTLAAREGLAVSFVQADATRVTAAGARMSGTTHAVALHACGDLHLALLHTGSAAGIAAFDIAPCCFHLTRATHWGPLSQALRDTACARLGITREELRLAVREVATSSARVVRQQRRLAAWRLGFDSLQRDLRCTDAYLPTPSRPARVLAQGFAAFCTDLAAHHGLLLPADMPLHRYEQAGTERLARVRRLELLRHACRRPLEVLLVADRALYLAERGYQVEVRAFCPRPLTPRNLLIQARRAAGHSGPAAG